MFLVYFLFLLLSWHILWRRKRSNLPPGPPRLPLLGSLPFLSMERGLVSWLQSEKITRHKITTVALGPQNLFVINSFEIGKDLFSKNEFSGRGVAPFFFEHKGFDQKPFGIIMTEGNHWVRERRFGLKMLKSLGLGRQSLEKAIHYEADEMILTLLQQDADFYLKNDFNIPMINILWQIVAGSRFAPENEEGMKLVTSVNRKFEIVFKMELFPLPVMKLFPRLTYYQEMVEILDTQKEFILKQIEEHEQSLVDESPRDFIDLYLLEMKKSEGFSKKDLALNLMDFLDAGTETSSTTLKWIILYLTVFQEVQQR